MPDSTQAIENDQGTTRRGFLKRVAIIGAAASALGLLSRGPFSRAKSTDRSVPPNLPGAGSIFQPRNDGRRQR
ncbi:MAG: twin-arginine translocation signal domain-containing protein [Dehalococcoidia bacterium]